MPKSPHAIKKLSVEHRSNEEGLDFLAFIGIDLAPRAGTGHVNDMASTSGGIIVLPNARVRVRPRARYLSDFLLIKGRVGRLGIK